MANSSLEKTVLNCQGGNFLHSVGDKDNLQNTGFLGIIGIGMIQFIQLTKGWTGFYHADASQMASAVIGLRIQQPNYTGENNDSKTD